MENIVLASASPRRHELLKNIGLEFGIIASDIEEKIDSNVSPELIVQNLSLSKAMDVADRLSEDAIVVGADTIVVHEDMILGKPKDYEEAYRMLKSLSGKIHNVITGFTIHRTKDKKTVTDFEKTLVEFNHLSDSEIDSYVATKEPMDKAGSYGIQNIGSLLVKRIEGDYFNVVGLPVSKLARILMKEFDIKIL